MLKKRKIKAESDEAKAIPASAVSQGEVAVPRSKMAEEIKNASPAADVRSAPVIAASA